MTSFSHGPPEAAQAAMPDSPSLSVRLFGPLEVCVRGRSLPRLRSRRGLWLLALLALRRGHEVSRSLLAGTLWPDSTEARALSSLRMSLADLRQALGAEAERLHSPTPRTLRLELHDASVDLLEFDAALAEGAAGASQEALERAVALYRGPLLEGCAEEWVVPDRSAREEAYLQALQALADRALATGSPERAVEYLRRAVAADPFREDAQRCLMRVLARTGNHAAATLVYRELRLRLHQEINAAPDPETRALYEQLRADGRRQAALSAVPAIYPAKGSPLEEGATPRLGSPQVRLPRPLTEFVGREQEVEEVASRVGRARLVTLTGPGGVGKTRLAIESAARLAEDFADGVLFTDLSSLEEGELVVGAVAALVGAGDAPLANPTALSDYFRPRQVLLILDNCEQVSEPCAWLAAALLGECPHLRIVATSRHALGIAGEAEWRVPPLSLPPHQAGSAAEDASASEAVQLFLQRAAAAQPAFRLTDENAAAVRDLCWMLDGLPLALELAAARLKVLTVEQIRDHLAAAEGRRFQLLTGGSRLLQPRQQTLRAAMDWSYRLLSPKERMLLRRLSVFAGDFDLEAAEAVGVSQWSVAGRRSVEPEALPDLPQSPQSIIEAREVLDLLAALVEKSLVTVREQRLGKAEARAVYRLLETTRAYMREQLAAAGEEPEARERHAAFYLSYALGAEPGLFGPEGAAWLDRLEAVVDNLRAALSWWTRPDAGPDAERALQLAVALRRFWRARRDGTEGVTWLEKGLAAASGRTRAVAAASLALASLYLWREAWDRARAVAAESLAISEELGDEQGAAAAVEVLALAEGEAGRPDEAERLLRRHPSRGGVSALAGLAALAYQRGDFSRARALQEECLALERERGDELQVAAALTRVSGVAVAQGDYAAAERVNRECLEINRRLNHPVGIAWSLDNLADIALVAGEEAQARELYRESLEIFAAQRYTRGIADCLIGFAEMAARRAERGDLSGEDAAHAALLLAAAEALNREAHPHLSTYNQRRFDRAAAGLEAVLGAPAWTAAREQGFRTPVQDAVALALREP